MHLCHYANCVSLVCSSLHIMTVVKKTRPIFSQIFSKTFLEKPYRLCDVWNQEEKFTLSLALFGN